MKNAGETIQGHPRRRPEQHTQGYEALQMTADDLRDEFDPA